MKRIATFAAMLVLCAASLVVIGCPSGTGTQRQQVAQAAENASIVVKNFQQGEIVAYQQGLIPATDHQFIQKELVTVGTVGKTLDTCIRLTTTDSGIVSCANTATSALDQINTDGGLYIKSTSAKQDFALAIIGTKTAIAVIGTIFGGKT